MPLLLLPFEGTSRCFSICLGLTHLRQCWTPATSLISRPPCWLRVPLRSLVSWVLLAELGSAAGPCAAPSTELRGRNSSPTHAGRWSPLEGRARQPYRQGE